MPSLTADDIWRQTDVELKATLESGALKPIGSTVRFYAPSFTYYRSKHYCGSKKEFPTVSVTGCSCSLNCRHCGGKVLETMHPATTPEALFDLAKQLKLDGAKGVLISGGCLPDGSVPLDDFTPVLGRLKRELGLTVFVHTGIVNSGAAQALKEAGVDAALIDVIGSDKTIRQTLNLNVTVQDYAQSLHALSGANLNVVPHVIVGLNRGEIVGEPQTLRIIAENAKPQAVVIIAFMPIHGTEMATAPSPTPLSIARVAAAARATFPNTPVALGCMRPKGTIRAETDIYALKAGVDAIAFPSDQAVEYAKTRGGRVEFSSYCCAQMYHDLGR
jgi:lipoyl synthase